MYNFFGTMVNYGEKIIINMKEFYKTLSQPMSEFALVNDLGLDILAEAVWGLPPDGTLLDLIIMGGITVIISTTLISWLLDAIPVL